MSVLYSTEAVFAASHSDRVGQDTVQAFYRLGIRLINRLHLFNQPGDAQHCIEYFRYLESQSLEAFGVSSHDVKVPLLRALASQVKLGIGNAAQNIDEMMDRFRDLLDSNIPLPLLRAAIQALTNANDDYSHHSPASEYSEILIDRLGKANRRLGFHDPYVAGQLAMQLAIRFRARYSIDDYEEAMAHFDKIITSDPNRDCLGPDAASALFFSVVLAGDRADIYENPEYLEGAIYQHRNFLGIPSTDDFKRSVVTGKLASLMRERSSYFGITGEGLPGERSPDPEVTSFRHLTASLRSRSTNDRTNWWAVSEERAKYLEALDSVYLAKDIVEITEAIEFCQLLLEQTPPSNIATYLPARALGNVLFHAFECTDNIEYLNKSITAFRNMLEMPSTKWACFQAISRLHNALLARHVLSGDQKDFDEVMQLCSMASKDPYANVPDRLRLSYSSSRIACDHSLFAGSSYVQPEIVAPSNS